MNREDCSRAKV